MEMNEWPESDAPQEWLTSDIVLVDCPCGTETLTIKDRDIHTCPQCGKRYRLFVTAFVGECPAEEGTRDALNRASPQTLTR